MLAMFDYVPTVHKSLGGLEHMERPPRSFERKLDLLTMGNCAEPKWPTGVFTYPRTTYLSWPFPSIVWLRSDTNMKVETSVQFLQYLVQNPLTLIFHGIALSHLCHLPMTFLVQLWAEQ